MTTLDVSLLGPVRILRSGTPVRGNAALLLAYLVTEAGVPASREWLAQAFWPNRPVRKSLHSLRQVLLALREAPGDAPGDSPGDSPSTPPLLRVTEDTVEVEAGGDIRCDVSEFMSLFDACDAHTHRAMESCAPCLRRLSRATDLMRGDFCEGSPVWDRPMLEDWLRRWTTSIGDRAKCSLEILTVAHAAHLQWGDALHAATRWVAIDPWADAAQRWEMRALWRGGNRVAAMTRYDTFRRMLGDDLGVEPESETIALYEQISADPRRWHGNSNESEGSRALAW